MPRPVPPATTPLRRHGRVVTLLVAAALVLAACGGGPADGDPGGAQGATDASDQLAVAFASFDVAVGEDRRIMTGLLSSERELLAHGEVTLQLGHLGEEAAGEVELTQQTTASFLGIPGMEPAGAEDTPRFLSGEPGNGVYVARVDLDEPGNWGLRVVAELADGRVLEGRSVFRVLPEPEVPTVGDPAPRTVNLTAADAEAGRIAPAAIDSRAGGTDPTIPDRHLHDTVIAEALDAGEPLVVAVTTPVYCMSRFCGPLTDVLAEMAHAYADTASFVHLEVWKDHDAQEVNEAAGEWILTETGGGNEPWVFVVDGDGTIVARWDNVVDLEELEATLAAL